MRVIVTDGAHAVGILLARAVDGSCVVVWRQPSWLPHTSRQVARLMGGLQTEADRLVLQEALGQVGVAAVWAHA